MHGGQSALHPSSPALGWFSPPRSPRATFSRLREKVPCGAEGGSNRRCALCVALFLGAATPALAQQAGWHYSPLPGEGDRATLGCSYGATPETFTCLAVRCEDDFTVGIHIHTSRPEGDAGAWVLEFDREMQRFPVTAIADGSPYGARIGGDIAPILQNLKDAGLVYLDPAGSPPISRAISLSGSLRAINQALYFCAPRTPSASDDAAADEEAPAEG